MNFGGRSNPGGVNLFQNDGTRDGKKFLLRGSMHEVKDERNEAMLDKMDGMDFK